MQTLIRGEELLNFSGTMRLETVPNDNNVAGQFLQQATEEGSDQYGIYIGIGMQAKEKTETASAGSDTKGGYRGDFLMRAGFLIKDRSLPTGTPSPSDKRSHQKAAFIDKSNMCFQAGCFFLMRGQSRLTHCLIASSFRSTARRSGFCGLQPKECRSLPI